MWNVWISLFLLYNDIIVSYIHDEIKKV
jgi:hypothetical protein